MTPTIKLSAVSLALAGAVLATPAFADTLVIRDFVGRVEVQTGSYNRIEARVTGGDGRFGEAAIDRNGDDVSVDGRHDLRWGGFSCRGSGDRMEVRIGGSRGLLSFGGDGDFVRVSDLPLLQVTAPSDVRLETDGAMLIGEIGDIGSGDVGNGGCGALHVGNVAGDLRAGMGGSGQLTAGRVAGDLDADLAGSGEMVISDVGGSATASLSGSGDLAIGRVSRGADIQVAGSGMTHVAEVRGELNISIAGSGDVVVAGGIADTMDVSIMGSGDVTFGGETRRLNVRVAGSGDVDVAQAADSNVRVAGSGDVRIAGRKIDTRSH